MRNVIEKYFRVLKMKWQILVGILSQGRSQATGRMGRVLGRGPKKIFRAPLSFGRQAHGEPTLTGQRREGEATTTPSLPPDADSSWRRGGPTSSVLTQSRTAHGARRKGAEAAAARPPLLTTSRTAAGRRGTGRAQGSGPAATAWRRRQPDLLTRHQGMAQGSRQRQSGRGSSAQRALAGRER